jgi:hypothetical protein
MGKGSAPTQQNITQTNIPEYARPYFERLMDRGEALSLSEYQPFEGQRLATAGMGDIESAFGAVRDIAGSGISGLPQAMGVTGSNMMAGQRIAQQAGQPFQFGQAGFSQFAPTAFGGFQGQSVTPFAGFQGQTVDPFATFREGQAEQFQFDPMQRFTGAAVEEYMSPYMQSVVGRQQQDAIRQFQEQGAGRAAQAVRAGAFGGSRQGVQEGIAERGLLDRLSDIQATGSQQAFEQATQAFGADRAADFARQQAQAGELARTQGIGVSESARVQESMAREMARVQGISVDEARRIQESQAQEMARVQGISIEEARRIQQAQAGEQARVQSMQAGELGRVEAARAGEMGRVQAAQAAEQRAALQQQLAALGFSSEQAQQMVGFGEAGRAADIQGAQLLENIGRSQRGFEQEQLDLNYQDFIRQQAFDEQQLQGLASLLRGIPMQPGVTQTAYAPYNPLQQLLGGGLGAVGLYRGLTG